MKPKSKITCETCKKIIRTGKAYINGKILCQRCWYKEKHKIQPGMPKWLMVKPVGSVGI